MFKVKRAGDPRRAAPDTQERGLAWRANHHVDAPLATEATVLFIIPLIAKVRTQQWDLVQTLLSATLGSVLRQTNPNWQVRIVGQDRPNFVEDKRIQFVNYDHFDPKVMIDKGPKIARVATRLTPREFSDGYIFVLDADDLLHPKLVDYMLTTGDRKGYIIRSGYMMDAESGAFATLYKSIFKNLNFAGYFSSHCGSCVGVRVNLSRGPEQLTPLLKRSKHSTQHHALAAYGMAPRVVPFPAALYLVNHGENMRLRRGKQDTKLRYLQRFKVSPHKAHKIRAEFGL